MFRQRENADARKKAMHDGDDRETPNLSLHQLANLFGFLKTDADDNIISVEPDYDDELVEAGPSNTRGFVEELDAMDESS